MEDERIYSCGFFIIDWEIFIFEGFYLVIISLVIRVIVYFLGYMRCFVGEYGFYLVEVEEVLK